MSEAEVRGLFALAGLTVLRLWELPNSYENPRHMLKYYQEAEPDRPLARFSLGSPWWLVKTPAGLIEIGWRKRVIAIDWSDTALRQVVTTDDVTKSETGAHAWSVEKALEYLRAFSAAIGTEQAEQAQ